MQIDDEPALGWTLVLRRQPVHLVAGIEAYRQHDIRRHGAPPTVMTRDRVGLRSQSRG